MASAPERADADKALNPIVRRQRELNLPPAPTLVSIVFVTTLFFYVGLPALIAALLFRGGLVLLATGITFVRSDGLRASRLRLFWRALVRCASASSIVPQLGPVFNSCSGHLGKTVRCGWQRCDNAIKNTLMLV